jgi:hypothetical protein
MDGSTALFCEAFGFSLADTDLALNVGNYTRRVSKNVIKLIKDRNQYDIALYSRGMDIFESQLQPKWMDGRKGTENEPINGRVFLDMDDHVNHIGMHRRELWPDWGGARWTRMESFVSLECTVLPDVDYVFKMFVLGVVNPSKIIQLSVAINGKKLKLEVKAEYSSFRISAAFRTKKKLVRPKVKIFAPFAIRPCDVATDGMGDKRVLGVAVKWIYIGPCDDHIEANLPKNSDDAASP